MTKVLNSFFLKLTKFRTCVFILKYSNNLSLRRNKQTYINEMTKIPNCRFCLIILLRTIK